jgi:hypothetical protein
VKSGGQGPVGSRTLFAALASIARRSTGANDATLLNVLIGAATGTPTTDFRSSGGKELTAIEA